MDNGDRLTTTTTAERMAGAASAFLGALTEEQRKQACYGFGDERRSWSYLPARDRDGLPIGALDAGQRKLGHELIVTGTSMPAYAKVVSVIAMEHVLRAMAPESLEGLFDPDRYCFKVFGSPGEAAWGWQFAGHHVVLNFTVADGRYVSPTPCMLGSQPASFGMLAPLADDEELGFRLVNSLDAGQRHAAIIHHRPPPDLAARMVPKIGETERPDPVFAPEPDYVISEEERDILSYVRASPKGVPASALSRLQFDSLTELVGAIRTAAARRGGRGAAARPGTDGHGLPHLRLGGRHLTRRPALLPGAGPDPAHRARQHAGKRHPHPFGVAEPGGRFR